MHNFLFIPNINLIFFLWIIDSIFFFNAQIQLDGIYVYFYFSHTFCLFISVFLKYLKIEQKNFNYFFIFSLFYSFSFFPTFLMLYTKFNYESVIIFIIHHLFLNFFIQKRQYQIFLLISIMISFICLFILSYDFLFMLNKRGIIGFTSFVSVIILNNLINGNFIQPIREKKENLENNIKSITHDIVSPLLSVKLYIQKIYKENKDIKNLEQSVQKIIEKINFCIFLVESQHKNVKLYLPENNRNLIDIKKTLYTIVNDFQMTHRGNYNIKITGEDVSFKTHKPLLINIFNNLLSNSDYFIKKYNKGDIYIHIYLNKEWINISFKDTACGISADNLPYIFDKGFTNRINGTGLGLFMCSEILGILGGKIKCNSVLGEYTEMILTFPLK